MFSPASVFASLILVAATGVSAQAPNVQLLDEEVHTLKTKVKMAEAESKGLGKELENREQQMRRRVRSLYRLRRAGMLPLAGGFSAMLQHVGRLNRLEDMVDKDSKALVFLREKRSALSSEAEQGKIALAQKEQALNQARQSAVAMQTNQFFGGNPWNDPAYQAFDPNQ